ncbi:hypothetical protein BKA69DRAFT_1104304 [Paraphysoderma sedebokerense]|nr:hypothetical protein BKA69DRAFT_1104304 [Paraphysoderma sedebokerense]
MSSSECAVLALIHDKVRPAAPLQNWTNIAPPAGFPKGACCAWQGVGCDLSGGTVTSLYIGKAGLIGSIPNEIASLTGLVELNMFQNSLTGTIPSDITSLTNLKNIAFGINSLSGTIPEAIGRMKQLTAFIIDKNQVSGTIPPAIQSLTSLQLLNLGVNSLSGSIPKEIGGCKALQTAFMWSNQLSGQLPLELYDLVDLKVLALDTNSLSGTIPAKIKNLKSLTKIDLRANSFTSISPAITSLPLSDCKIEENPYSCLPSLPAVCDRPTLATASKCPNATDESEGGGGSGAVKSEELIAILASVIGVVVLIVVGVFCVRRRKQLKRLEREHSTVGFGKDGKENSSSLSVGSDSTQIGGSAIASSPQSFNVLPSSGSMAPSMAMLPVRTGQQMLLQGSSYSCSPALNAQPHPQTFPHVHSHHHLHHSNSFPSPLLPPVSSSPSPTVPQNQQDANPYVSMYASQSQRQHQPVYSVPVSSNAIPMHTATQPSVNNRYETLRLSSQSNNDGLISQIEQPKLQMQEGYHEPKSENVLYLSQ